MRLNDILLALDSYPQPCEAAAVDQAIAFARMMDSKLSAIAVQVDIHVKTNRLADYLIGISHIAAEEEKKSARACHDLLELFRARGKDAGVLGDALLARAEFFCVGDRVAERARTRDLCLVAVNGRGGDHGATAEAVVFGSGRGTLVFQPGVADLPRQRLGTVVLAWDGTRASARAMAAALPVLARADRVRVLTVLGEKAAAVPGLGADAVRHLEAHGIDATADELEAGGQRIGPVLETFAKGSSADLLVMGAYGTSRVREFVLGGATEHMLGAPKIPLLLAH